MREGKIIKVSGPLVVAEGLVGAKMYDLVRVGRERLMGEIIELRGETASIQVYEETVGLGPGDPVFDTGEPLSVELGPGLLQSIYDGVQRPLKVIREKAGDFIPRGVEAPGLDRKKKWDFEPRVSKRDEVSPGDIIGAVQETEVIEHRIMVPPGIEGTVEEIHSGSFTVEEPVAIVKSKDGKKHTLTMLQRWPVRKPRLYRKKLAPFKPLSTGQRVVDTFFPITKGGTACVPGPFGSGKCVSGDTPVRLGDGRIIPIKEVFDEYGNKGKITKGESEEYTLLEEPFEVFSYIDGKILKNKVSAVYKGKTNKLIRIKTRTGRTVKVTPIHKLLKMESDLTVREMEVKELRKGDYLVAPRFIDSTGEIHEVPVVDIFGNSRVADDSMLKKVPLLIDELAQAYDGKKEVAKKLHIGYDVLIGYYLRRNKPTVDFVRELYELAGMNPPRITQIKGERQSKKVRIPTRLNQKLATFLGLMLGDGSLKNNSVRFYNNDERMLALFEEVAVDLFGLSAKRSVVNTVKCSFIESTILAKLLKYFGYPEYKKSRSCIVPVALQNSPESVIGAFLGAYFACDGYFHAEKGEIEYGTASKTMQTGLSYLLLRLGVLSRLSAKTAKGFKQYRVFISSRDEIRKFYDHCALRDVPKFQKMREYLCQTRRGYTGLDIVPLGKEHLAEIYNLAQRPYARLKEKGVEIHNYLSGEIMSRRMFKNFAEVLNDHSLIAFAVNHLGHIYCDRIVDVEEIDEVCDVYDLEVPEGHNFLGGHAPMILHNTVIQHQFARWSDAQIIVFVGCGERGNEMTEVLIDFPELIDPYSGRPLMERTVLIANTSNMPVAAREASIYTGITIGEYFRDMGYDVALQADSTSRWAEALREISGRLEEMPGEEGYPAYLGSRAAAFYERAGKVVCLGKGNQEGSLTAIGSVSPPGGDLSEPVTQATLRVVKVFWGLVDWLAYQRHFPSIDWLISYSLYLDKVQESWSEDIAPDFKDLRTEAMSILQREAELKEIVRLVGIEALSMHERIVMETAKSIREDFLQQNAYHELDTFTSLKKQYLMLKLIMTFHKHALEAVERDKPLQEVITAPVREKITRAKYIDENKLGSFEDIEKEIKSELMVSSVAGGVEHA